MCNLVAETSSSSFFFEGSCLRKKTEDDFCCLQKQLYLVVYSGEGRVFFFVCLFHFASSFVCVSFCLWSLSFITCLHDTYTPSLGHKHLTQYRRTTLASKGNKQKKKCDLSSRRVRLCQHTYMYAYRGRDFQVEARFLGSIHVRVNGVSGLTYDTCGHSKTDLFENGSF